MGDELSELYQQVILDHSKSPRNFRDMPNANRMAEGYNPLCGDNVKIFLHMENDVIRDISFQGSGCAISKASASLMTAALKGKTRPEAEKIFNEFQKMVMGGAADEAALGKLAVFAGVKKFASRVKCAILPWHAVTAGLEGKDKPVSTE
jgi:nitrogen fixation NifU-like protein